jgi:signal transduction histidine kinase
MGICELDGTIVAANAATASLLRRPLAQIIGSKGWAFAPGGEHLWPDIIRTAQERGEYRSEITVATPDATRTVEYVVVLRQHEERTLAVFFGFAREATRREPPDPRLEQLGLVAGGIAHELNNQLTIVLAEAGAAREEPSLGCSAVESLQLVEAAAHRMAQLTRQLLAYAGRGRYVAELLDPDQLLRGASLGHHVRADVALRVAPAAPGAVVEADRAMLLQIFNNLVANASEAHAGPGSIDVTTRADGIGWWQLQVRDRGAGMDTAAIARIWDPFFSTKAGHQGLGLSAVAGIVRRLGGEIDVESKPGDGATFSLRLPIVRDARLAAEAAPVKPAAAASLAGLRALVADDEPAVRAAIRRVLERRHAIVVLAADGSEAEARLREGQFHFIVLDVMMPGRTGYQLLPIVRQTNPQARVMLMSGYAELPAEAGAIEPNAFLEKPFTATSFDSAIDDLLR